MKRLEHILLALFIFSIPIQARLVLFQWSPAFNEWTAGFLWGTDILLALLVISNLKFQISKKDWLLILFLAIAAISILQARLVPVAIYRFIKLAEYIILFFYFRHRAVRILSMRTIAGIWVASSVFQALVGIAQYIIQHNLGLRFLGESILNVDGQSVAVVVANSHKYLRAYGTTPHPNVLGAILMVGLWAALWLYFTRLRHRGKILAAYAIILVAFLLTFSRVEIAVWIIATLVMVAIFWIRQKRKDFLAPLILTMLIGLAFTGIFWPQVHSRLQLSTDDEAVAQRVFYAKIAGQSARHHLIRGIGIGQFVPNLMRALPRYPAVVYQPAHSLYLLVLNEMGLPGLIVLLIFLGFWFSAQRGNPYVIVGMTVFLVLGLFDHFFWTLQQGGFVLWGLLGILASDII